MCMGNVFGLSGKKMTLSEIEKKSCEKTVAACVEKRGRPFMYVLQWIWDFGCKGKCRINDSPHFRRQCYRVS